MQLWKRRWFLWLAPGTLAVLNVVLTRLHLQFIRHAPDTHCGTGAARVAYQIELLSVWMLPVALGAAYACRRLREKTGRWSWQLARLPLAWFWGLTLTFFAAYPSLNQTVLRLWFRFFGTEE